MDDISAHVCYDSVGFHHAGMLMLYYTWAVFTVIWWTHFFILCKALCMRMC